MLSRHFVHRPMVRIGLRPGNADRSGGLLVQAKLHQEFVHRALFTLRHAGVNLAFVYDFFHMRYCTRSLYWGQVTLEG